MEYKEQLNLAFEIVNKRHPELRQYRDVWGCGAGVEDDKAIIYVYSTKPNMTLPQELEGIRVKNVVSSKPVALANQIS